MSGIKGMQVRTHVGPHDPSQQELAAEVRAVLQGQTVTDVYLHEEQLVIEVDSGQRVTFMISGGFRKVG